MTGRALTVTTLLVLILALGVLFRFHDAAAVPPGLDPDEAYNGTDALIALHDHSFKVFYPLNLATHQFSQALHSGGGGIRRCRHV